MQVLMAENAGFCFGVKRALQYAEDAVQSYGEIYSLGPLIHNPQEVERLYQKGIIVANDIQQVKGKYVIIRSHGVEPKIIALAREKGIKVIDATCPFVKRAQSYAQDLAEAGYTVVIVGDRNHPEVEGIVGWSHHKAIVIENVAEAKIVPLGEKVGVIAQTTQAEQNFKDIVNVLKKRNDQLIVYNTICHATAERQETVLDLAQEVDVLLVIGGLNSANTKKLARISSEAGTPTYQVEKMRDINKSWFDGKKKVGVTAGASTPDWIIKEVLQKMKEIAGQEERSEETMENLTEMSENEEMEKDPVGNASDEVSLAEVAEEGSGEETTDTKGDDKEETSKENTAEEENVEEAVESLETSSEPALETETETTADENEAMDNAEPSFADAYDKDIKRVQRGERITGTIVQVRDTEVLVDVGGKSEGVIPRSELSVEEAENIHEALIVGDQIEVLVLKRENDEGHPVLSKRRVDQEKNWEKLSEAQETGEFVTGKVIEVVKGGLLADLGVRGFIPASLVELGFVEDLKPYVGRELQLKIIECDRSNNKLILSQKAFLQEEAAKRKKETWEKIEEGQTVEGIVRRLTNFGAFVDVGGVDGLLHVSEMAWHRVNHPSDVLKEDDELEVYILALDRENEKISLGLKQLLPNPWDQVAEKYPVGTIIDGKVVRTAPFGAFLQIEPGVEGLVHISQLAHERVGKTEDVVSPGDEVQVKVLSVDQEAKRISLSIKEALDLPEEEPVAASYEERRDVAQESVHETEEEGFGITIGDLIGRDLKEE